MDNQNIPTVKELREKGYKVRVSHFRPISEHSDLFSFQELRQNGGGTLDFAHPKGGKTVVEIKDLEGNELYGEAICSIKDNFCRSEGRKWAVGRALGLITKQEQMVLKSKKLGKIESSINKIRSILEELTTWVKSSKE